jgi:hypothetical protein
MAQSGRDLIIALMGRDQPGKRSWKKTHVNIPSIRGQEFCSTVLLISEMRSRHRKIAGVPQDTC